MSDQWDLDNYTARHETVAFVLAHLDLVVAESECEARRLNAFGQRRFEEVVAALDTSAAAAAGILVAAVGIDQVELAADKDRDCHVVAMAGHMHRRAACSVVDSDHARRCVQERTLEFELTLE